jgi:hypothetical protein
VDQTIDVRDVHSEVGAMVWRPESHTEGAEESDRKADARGERDERQ